ncbi:MAG: stage II sporulation protein P [Bacilli bacterium]|nr:stage II sporulation protein P [Bacilli bacterium]
MKKKIFKLTIFLVVLAFSFILTVKYLSSYSINLDDDVISILLEESENTNFENRLINKVINTITKSKYINPVEYVLNNYEVEEVIPVINERKETKPTVYIYNTHENEKYSTTKELNIRYSVKDASNYLKDKLKTYNINSIVEKGSITDILNTNNWNYASSYKVSRMYLEKAKKDHQELTYFIDIHRDSVNKNISTIKIGNKTYARTMFLLGLENNNYKANQKVMEKLETWLNVNYKGLSRGIYEKKGRGVNGVYNQNFSPNCILIEVGGEENTYEEVTNTMDVIAEMLYEYMKGKL